MNGRALFLFKDLIELIFPTSFAYAVAPIYFHEDKKDAMICTHTHTTHKIYQNHKHNNACRNVDCNLVIVHIYLCLLYVAVSLSLLLLALAIVDVAVVGVFDSIRIGCNHFFFVQALLL